jgi:hypothetical protein
MAKTRSDLDVADTKFYIEARPLGFRGWLYGNAVSYFNQLARGPKMDAKSPAEAKQLAWLHNNLRTNGPIGDFTVGATPGFPQRVDVVDLRSGEMPSGANLPARYFPSLSNPRRRTRHRKQKYKKNGATIQTC